MIESFLRNIGLNNNEILIYLYLMAHSNSIASIIAKRVGLKRPTVYQALESLEKIGLVSSFIKNGTMHFDAEDTQVIVDLCDENLVQMNQLKEKAISVRKELNKLRNGPHGIAEESHEKIKYYEGLAAVTDLIDKTLDESEKEQLCFGINRYHIELAGNDWQTYTMNRVSRGMAVKSIQPDTDDAIAYKKRDKKELRKTRLVPKKKFPVECEINIIGDMIAMFSFHGKVPTGMKLHNKDMAQTLRSLFLLAWERAEEYDKGLTKKTK